MANEKVSKTGRAPDGKDGYIMKIDKSICEDGKEIYQALNIVTMMFNGKHQDKDGKLIDLSRIISATKKPAGTDVYIIHNGAHSCVRMDNKWVVYATDPNNPDKPGEKIHDGDYLINDRYQKNETIQILNHDYSNKYSYRTKIGTSYATADEIAKFLNKDITKNFNFRVLDNKKT